MKLSLSCPFDLSLKLSASTLILLLSAGLLSEDSWAGRRAAMAIRAQPQVRAQSVTRQPVTRQRSASLPTFRSQGASAPMQRARSASLPASSSLGNFSGRLQRRGSMTASPSSPAAALTQRGSFNSSSHQSLGSPASTPRSAAASTASSPISTSSTGSSSSTFLRKGTGTGSNGLNPRPGGEFINEGNRVAAANRVKQRLQTARVAAAEQTAVATAAPARKPGQLPPLQRSGTGTGGGVTQVRPGADFIYAGDRKAAGQRAAATIRQQKTGSGNTSRPAGRQRSDSVPPSQYGELVANPGG